MSKVKKKPSKPKALKVAGTKTGPELIILKDGKMMDAPVITITKNPEGRPPLFKSPEDLEKMVEEYFVYIKGEYHEEEIEIKSLKEKIVTQKIKVCDREQEPPTITGLALFLGFESRQSFYDYKENPKFSYTIKKARLRVEHEYEKSLHKSQPTGAIFALKNMGWADKQEIDHTSGGEKLEHTAPVIQYFNTAPPLAGSEDEVETEKK